MVGDQRTFTSIPPRPLNPRPSHLRAAFPGHVSWWSAGRGSEPASPGGPDARGWRSPSWGKAATKPCSNGRKWQPPPVPSQGSPHFSSVASIMLIITCLASVCFSGLCARALVWPCSWRVPSTKQPAWGVISACWENKQTPGWLNG